MKRIPEFEGLRGFLAWWVVIGHIIYFSGIEPDFFPQGIRLIAKQAYPVDVFIILSGFVIFMLIEKKHQSYKVFIIQRFFRLYPAFLVLFTLAVLMNPLKMEIFNNIPWAPNFLNEAAFRDIDYIQPYFWEHVWVHLTMLHAAVPNQILPNSSLAFLDPAWSTSIEWQFYLVAPLIFYCFKKFHYKGWLVFGLLSVVLGWGFRFQLDAAFNIQGSLPHKLFLFWIGITSFYIWDSLIEDPTLAKKICLLLAVGITPVVFVLTLSAPIALWFFVFFGVLAIHSNDDSFIPSLMSKLLCSKLAQLMGRISYSIYLSHYLVLYAVQWTALHFGWVSSKMELCFYLLITATIGTFFVSCFSYRYIEAPGMRLGRRLTT